MTTDQLILRILRTGGEDRPRGQGNRTRGEDKERGQGKRTRKDNRGRGQGDCTGETTKQANREDDKER